MKMAFKMFLICILVILETPYTKNQAIVGENCKNDENFDSNLWIKMKELQQEFSSFRDESYEKQIRIESELREVKGCLRELEDKVDRLGRSFIKHMYI